MRRFQSTFNAGTSCLLNRSMRSFASNIKIPITVAKGDGIGPDIVGATMEILKASGAPIEPEYVVIGEQCYLQGQKSGLGAEAWESMNRTKVMLKGPITTPLGSGYKSVNVTLRKTLGLFANVRPVFSYAPFVKALHPKLDVVIIRENEEDLYAGIEHRHTAEVMQCLKLITVPGCERICRYAFDYCRLQGRKKLTCVTKSNIMKLTDGTFQRVFEEMAKQYPDIKANHEIVDIATARLAARPQNYDVIVTLNLYGDIMSDVAAEVAGSVGLAGSANIGSTAAMFEAVHGSAPDIAGKDIANPSGVLNGAIMMLNYLKEHEIATTVHNALLRTMEDGIHTADMVSGRTVKEVGTKEFTKAIIQRLGKLPEELIPVNYVAHETHGRKSVDAPSFIIPEKPLLPSPKKVFVGVDVFVDYDPPSGGRNVEQLAKRLLAATGPEFKLDMISNRGVIVWPNGHPDTFKADHWRCRFVTTHANVKSGKGITDLLHYIENQGLDVIKMENLYTFDGEAGYSKGQGQ